MDSSSVTAPSPDSPPSDNSTSSPPPPSEDNNSASSPPPSDNNSSSSSPPPPTSNPSPPSPPSDSSSNSSLSSSPPPPPTTNGSDGDKSPSPSPSPSPPPPPPSSKGNSSTVVSTPPPQSSSSKSPPAKALSPPPPPPHKSSSSSPSKSSPSSSSSSVSSDNVKLAIGVSVAVGLFFILMIVLCCVCTRKKKKKRPEMQYWDPPQKDNYAAHDYYNSGQHPNWHNSGLPPGNSWGPPPPMMNSGDMSSNYSGPRPGQHPLPPPSPVVALGFNSSGQFTYDELAMATGGFNEANLIGQGGFGFVHKGVLPNGKEVAIKSLKSGSGQGEREFQAEVEIISRVHHRHLVTLEGYCIAGGQRMLVYEFVPNKTLECHLHGKDRPVMDWATRLKIAIGSAKGLAYLHEDCHPRIIHRDIKAANILLDSNFEAMVADFGLAKLSSDTNTHVSTRVMGTFGYLAPEYASSGKLTEKSDVFSFGVMLLELITGKRPVDTANYMEDSLVDWARPLMADGNYDELVDPRLEKNYNPTEMAHMVGAAAASIRHSARKRPKMSQIVRALEGDVSLDDLNEGLKPGQSNMFGSGTSLDYSAASYNADMKKFRMMALNSQELSSDYGGSSGDSKEMTRNHHSPL